MSIVERVKAYYGGKPQDGQGGVLSIQQVEEVLPGVVAVLDSLDEIDLFLDPSQYAINLDAPSPYRLFIASVQEALEHSSFAEKYGFVGVSEHRWHPFFARRRATFDAASEAARNYFKIRLL